MTLLRMAALVLAVCAVGAGAQEGQTLERRFVRLELPEMGCAVMDLQVQLLMRVAFHLATGAHLQGNPRRYCEGLNNLVLYAEVRDLTPEEAKEMDEDATAAIRRNLEDFSGLTIPVDSIKAEVRRDGNCKAQNAAVGWMESLTNTCVVVKCEEGYELSASNNICGVAGADAPDTKRAKDDGDDGPSVIVIAFVIALLVIVIIVVAGVVYCCCCKPVPSADSRTRETEPAREAVVDMQHVKAKELTGTEASEVQ